MHEELSGKGFELLAFPCNQFGGQEPGTSDEIHNFISSKFGYKFPIFQKCDVNGNNTHPIYQYLKAKIHASLQPKVDKISWNFAKFLVNGQGEVVQYFEPKSDLNTLRSEVEALLK